MKTALFLTLLGVVSAIAQQSTQRPAEGIIYGAVVGPDGNPAAAVGLTASPLGVALGAVLPHTRTNQSGHYRFEKVPWWGRYTVYADDRDAGYSDFSTGPAGPGQPPEVTISPQNPEARLDLHLPPKAGFLKIHLKNQITGTVIDELQVAVQSNSAQLLFTESCSSDTVVLIAPDRDLLLHVTSPGFREWDESVGKGWPLRMSSGSHLELDVDLSPE